ncbi:MAG TPA: hypothetical protein VHJ40_03020 [Actinomycetota bacterium]|jgi:hypothetical protein|nr:hypothetical protein [Actinomycetota bacterium]
MSPTPRAKSLLRRTVRIAFYPVFRYFGPRFAGITQRLEALEARAVQETQTMIRRLDEFESRALTDVETTVEVLSTARRSIGLLDRRIAELDDLLSRLPDAGDRSPAQLIEFAFAVHAGVALRPGSRVLLEGPANKELAFCLAAWGHDVLNGQPGAGRDVYSESGPIDAILHMSGSEAADLGGSGGPMLDRLAVKRFAELMAPGGQLVISVPYGHGGGSESFDAAGLEELLDGYEVLELRILASQGQGSGGWAEVERQPASDSWQHPTTGLALVRAALSG